MPLTTGDKLGPYEIIALLGEGGMGQVWKARDPRLNRTVAIKIAQDAFTERFEREARAIAALNHPHICQIHDVGPNYLVMELVEGAPLRGPMPPEKAVQIASQILDALDSAHRRGFVHRDLKPENILLTKQGVKLLDFGLAKQIAGLSGNGDTVTQALTAEGQISGTLQYMSPEQLQAKPVDARSDIFSFGCVLYELLTGKRAFEGGSAASVIAAIMEREPAPFVVPPPLERVIRTCLKKDPDERFQSALDLKRNLQWALEKSPEALPAKRRPWLAVGLALLGVAAGVAIQALVFTPKPARGLRPARTTRLTRDGRSTAPAVSPDGKLVAYSSSRVGSNGSDIYVQRVDGGGTVRLTDDPAMDLRPSFSADGSRIYFTSTRVPEGVYEVPALGGEARLVVPGAQFASASPDGKWLSYRLRGELMIRSLDGKGGDLIVRKLTSDSQRIAKSRCVWSADGKSMLAFTDPGNEREELWLIPVDGSEPRSIPLVSNLRRRGMYEGPTVHAVAGLPGGDLVFQAPFSNTLNLWRIGLAEASDGEPTPLTWNPGQSYGYADARAGILAYTQESGFDTLAVLAGNLNSGKIDAKPRRLVSDRVDGFHQDVTPDGEILAYCSRRGGSQGIWLLNLKSGKERLLASIDEPQGGYAHLSFSPDAKQLAATVSTYARSKEGRADWTTWVLDVSTGEGRMVSRTGARIRGWTPDGKYLLAWRPALRDYIDLINVASGEAVTILADPERGLSTPRLSPDGKWIVFVRGTGLALARFRGAQAIPAAEFLTVSEVGSFPFWSPDGKSIYYASVVSGRGSLSGHFRQAFDSSTGKLIGKPVGVAGIDDYRYAGAVVNQVIGRPGGIYIVTDDQVSDIWLRDLPPD